jgi:hypothetical protein
VEWGEISKADFDLPTDPADTSAAAVIVGNNEESSPNQELGISHKRYVRIKIFTPAGFQMGTHMILLQTRDPQARLSDLEVATYALGPDSNIVKTDFKDRKRLEVREAFLG